jgi:hemerythrin
MIWNDKLSVGVEVIDEDHKKLIAMINEMYDAILAGMGKKVVGDILDRLVHYTSFHFAREEALFAQTGYSDAAAHKAEHDAMAKWAIQAELDFHQGTLPAPSLEVINRLKDWLFEHINGTDKLYGPHLNAAGIH